MNTTLVQENRELIHSAVQKLQGQFPPQVIASIEEAIIKIDLGLQLPVEAMELPLQFVEELYNKGYHLFQSGKFKEALPVFVIANFLLMGAEPKLLFSIAACHHHLKEFTAAAHYYMLYQTFDLENPIPFYHLYDCFQQTGHFIAALAALKTAKELAAKKTKYTELLYKIDLQLSSLEKES